MSKSKNKLIVISFDALIYEDIEYLKNQPNFAYLIENGAIVNKVKSIYPTITYPCHTTMITGCWPDKHGVINNTYDIISENPPWKFGHENVLCTDLMDACKKSGLKTASIGWPVSGNHPNVDYLVNECWPETDNSIESYEKTYLENGTPEWLFNTVVKPILNLRIGRKQPESSYFLGEIGATIIKKYQPDILVIHPSVVDAYRHLKGVFSEITNDALECCDKILGLLIKATKDAGVFEDTNFIVTADHGQLNITRIININCLFEQNGFIKLNETGKIEKWDAFCFPMGGMSAYIKLKNPSDKNLHDNVYALLKEKCHEGLWGFSQVFTREECQQMHLDGDFSFVIETDGYTKFGLAWSGHAVENMPLGLTGLIRGEHGFHPDKGPRPPLIACGPAIKKGVVLEDADLVDGAPTYAKILGVELPEADGVVLHKLLNI